MSGHCDGCTFADKNARGDTFNHANVTGIGGDSGTFSGGDSTVLKERFAN